MLKEKFFGLREILMILIPLLVLFALIIIINTNNNETKDYEPKYYIVDIDSGDDFYVDYYVETDHGIKFKTKQGSVYYITHCKIVEIE